MQITVRQPDLVNEEKALLAELKSINTSLQSIATALQPLPTIAAALEQIALNTKPEPVVGIVAVEGTPTTH